ncbi:S8 family serine peptidase [Gammaproteobacteria bacterium]|jgi:hypothetical protein|nr:S8 family serine peptidase [Gammaproteobacteria bacterium]
MSIRASLVGVAMATVLIAPSYSPVQAGGVYGWHLAAIGVTEKMHSNRRMRGKVNVGVLDVGVLCSHTAFSSGACSNVNHPDPDITTGVGNHGTHVATTIAANDRGTGGMVGVAPGATITSWAIMDNACEGGQCGYADGAKTFGWANCRTCYGGDIIDYMRNANKVSITNHSYGVPTLAPFASELRRFAKPENKNIVTVWALGNDNKDVRNRVFHNNFQPRDSLKNLIFVTALAPNLKRAVYSNTPGENGFCNVTWQGCRERNKYKYFTVSAPGGDGQAGDGQIYAGGADGGYYWTSGTSMAAPIVSGVAALLHGRWPALKRNASKTTSIIFRTAQDLGKPGVDAIYGWGMVRADRALGPLGAKYLKKKKKKYSLANSSLRVSPALSNLTNQSVSFFDEYDRDFQTPLATYAPSYQGIVQSWVKTTEGRNDYVMDNGRGLSYAFSAQDYNAVDPSLADIEWRMSYQRGKGQALHFGQGSALEQLGVPTSFSFGLMTDKTIQTGAYPVMGLAEGGVYALLQRPLTSGFSIAGGALTNTRVDSEAKDRDYAPKTDAMVISLGRVSDDTRLSTKVSVSYLTEDNGVLGTGGAGGLEFADGSNSQGVTLGSSYQLNRDSKVSASYTEAFSRSDASSDNLLSLNSARLTSCAFAVGLESKNVFDGADRLKFSVSQPLRVNGGSMSLMHDDYYDEDEVLHARSVDIDLKPTGRQIDYQLEYVFQPKPSGSTLGLFAYYADDYLHQASLVDYGFGLRVHKSF